MGSEGGLEKHQGYLRPRREEMRPNRKRNAMETSLHDLKEPRPEAALCPFLCSRLPSQDHRTFISKLLLTYSLLRPGEKMGYLMKINVNTLSY